MIHAYDKALLRYAENLLGHMLDFSVHSLHMDISSMMDLFTASGLAAGVESGDICIICGMSGVELAYEILNRSGIPHERISQRHTISLSAEYWVGCALVRLQYETGLHFIALMNDFDASGFIKEYADRRTKFLDKLPFELNTEDRSEALRRFGEDYIDNALQYFTSGSSTSRLKKMRIKNGLSQSGLAKASGIPLRTIQQYEQHQKDLSRAHASSLLALASVLHCDPASLLD